MARRRPYIENCPTCTVGLNIAPDAIRDSGPDSVIAAYHCPRCATAWTTSWQRERTASPVRP